MFSVSDTLHSVERRDQLFSLADNRRKVRNMLSQAPDFSAFIRTTTNAVASKISAQMKVAVFQFLSTSEYSLCSFTG